MLIFVERILHSGCVTLVIITCLVVDSRCALSNVRAPTYCKKASRTSECHICVSAELTNQQLFLGTYKVARRIQKTRHCVRNNFQRESVSEQFLHAFVSYHGPFAFRTCLLLRNGFLVYLRQGVCERDSTSVLKLQIIYWSSIDPEACDMRLRIRNHNAQQGNISSISHSIGPVSHQPESAETCSGPLETFRLRCDCR